MKLIPISKKKQMHTEKCFLKEFKYNKFLYLLTVPALVYFILFHYIPMVGMIIAFQDFNPIKGLFGSTFVGLENFEFFFTSGEWSNVTFNTVFLNGLFISSGLIAAIVLAVMISEVGSKLFKKTSQSVMMLPHFISWPVVSMFCLALFSSDTGMINIFLKELGFSSVSFYRQAEIWPFLLTLLKIWKGTGYQSVIFMAAIAGIEDQLYESAKIDGASRLQCIVYITLPLLRTTALLLMLLALGRIFYGDLGMIYAIVGDNPLLFPTTDVIDTFVLRSLRTSGSMGMSAAVGLYQSLVGFILVIISNSVTRKYDRQAAIY